MISAPAEKDINGRDLEPLWAMFTEDEIHAAERMARADRFPIRMLHNDPVGRAWRYLRYAQLALRGRDPGAAYREPATRQPRRATAEQRALRVATRA